MNFLVNNACTLLLLFFVGLGIIGHNSAITIASLILLLIQQTPLIKFAPFLERYGLKFGILMLTIGVLTPLITGKIQTLEIVHLLSSWRTIAAVLIGLMVAWLGGRGVQLMAADPTVVTGLMVGTILGVAFCKGVPVGPLIAAGLLSLLFW